MNLQVERINSFYEEAKLDSKDVWISQVSANHIVLVVRQWNLTIFNFEKRKVSYNIDLKQSKRIIEIAKHLKSLYVLYADEDGESKLGIS